MPVYFGQLGVIAGVTDYYTQDVEEHLLHHLKRWWK